MSLHPIYRDEEVYIMHTIRIPLSGRPLDTSGNPSPPRIWVRIARARAYTYRTQAQRPPEDNHPIWGSLGTSREGSRGPPQRPPATYIGHSDPLGCPAASHHQLDGTPAPRGRRAGPHRARAHTICLPMTSSEVPRRPPLTVGRYPI